MPAPTARLGRLLRRHRRAVAALLLALAAAVTVHSVLPAPAGTAVVAAGRDLPAGHVLDASDLTTVLLPRAAVPTGALDRDLLVGARLASAVRAGEAVTDVRVSGAGLTAALPAGQVAVPVLLGAQVRPWLSVGQRLRLVAPALTTTDPWSGPAGSAAGPATPTVATVLDVAAPAGSGPLAGGGTDVVPVLVQVPDDAAAALAGSGGPVAAVLLGGG